MKTIWTKQRLKIGEWKLATVWGKWFGEREMLRREMGYVLNQYDASLKLVEDLDERVEILEFTEKRLLKANGYLQAEVSELKAAALLQKQERLALYEQRDELRRMVLAMASAKEGDRPVAIPDWVRKSCDEDGGVIRPEGRGG